MYTTVSSIQQRFLNMGHEKNLPRDYKEPGKRMKKISYKKCANKEIHSFVCTPVKGTDEKTNDQSESYCVYFIVIYHQKQIQFSTLFTRSFYKLVNE